MHRLGTTRRLSRAGYPVLVAGAVLLAVAMALATPAWTALANGTPIRVTLRYLNGVSNFGPQNATGTAELITSEGEVRLLAAGLQKLADNEEYQLWLSFSDSNDTLRLGTLQVNDSGVGRLDTVLRQPIPERPFNLLVVTVESKGSQPAAPSEKRSIAGRPESGPGSGEAPRVLPNTGGNQSTPETPASSWLGLSTGGTILLGLLVVGVIGFALGRAGARRGT